MGVPTASESFLPQESLLNPNESTARQDIPMAQSYPRVEDNYSMHPVESISPVVTDLPTLLPFDPLIQRSPIVG